MLFLLLSIHDAHAWKHTGTIWKGKDSSDHVNAQYPVAWYLDDEVEESLPEGYDQSVLEESWDNWNVVTCAAYVIAGGSADFQTRKDMGSRDPFDQKTAFYYNDPNDEAATGVLGVTYTIPSGYLLKVANGRTYYGVAGSDIIFNDNVDFASTEDIANGKCSNESSIEAVATHEIGHMLGMGHSCEQSESCESPTLKEATMYWSAGPCDIHQSEPQEDDIEGMNALYGPTVGFDAVGGRGVVSGAVDLDVGFELLPDKDVTVTDALWNFGDGQTSTELEPTHTYTVPGQYTVTVTVDATTPDCGSFNNTSSKLGMVTACGMPTPTEGAEGFFQMEEVDGLRWKTINHVDMSVYGCVDQIAWQIYKGDKVDPANLLDLNKDGTGDVLGAWAPEFQFPEAGTYTVLVNVGGPAGTTAGKLTVDVVESSGGCSTAPTVGGIGALFLAGLAALRRRRA